MFNLWEMTFFIDQCKDIEGLVGQDVQCALVVVVLNVCPDYVFAGVLILLKLEDVLHKELLQLFIGKVDAQLLKAVNSPHKHTHTHTCTHTYSVCTCVCVPELSSVFVLTTKEPGDFFVWFY